MRRVSLLPLALSLFLSGCAAPAPESGAEAPEAPPAAVSQPEPSSQPGGFSQDLLPDPDSDPAGWTLADFPGLFGEEPPTRAEEYPLLEGTELQNTVLALHGQEEGPSVYIVASVHGDEKAGWMAGNLLKEISLKAGHLYILSPANPYGAEQDQRSTQSGHDLNRNFPGDPDGWDAGRMAFAIFEDIQDKSPGLVLDLHEARARQGERDALGNSVICQSLDGIGELVLDIILKSEAGQLCSSPFTLYGSPPQGSVNRTVTLELGVPVITVETYREEPIAQRVRNQLELTEFVLEYYGLI